MIQRFVLDTHAFVFALTAPNKLGKEAKKALLAVEAGHAHASVPAIVVAEVIQLKGLGRVALGFAEITTALQSGLTFLPLDFDQLSEFAACAVLKDPFDRLVVAAARAARAKLITKDGAIVESGLVQVVW